MAIHEQPVIAVMPKSGKRRSFSRPFKRELVEQTLRSNVSVAGVALANGINANLLARWRRDYLLAQAAGKAPALVPVHVVASQPVEAPARTRPAVATGSGEIEVRHGDSTVIIRGAPHEFVLGIVLATLLQSRCGSPR
jgi:transposase